MTPKERLTQLTVAEAESLFDARATGDLSVPYLIPIPGTNGYWAVTDELSAWRQAQFTSRSEPA